MNLKKHIIKELYIFVIIWLSISSVNLCAQNSDSQSAKEVYRKAYQEYENGAYRQALSFSEKALQQANAQSKDTLLAQSTHLIGNIFSKQNNYSLALEYLFRAFNLFEKQNNNKKLIGIETEIAQIYFRLHAYEKAQEHFQKAYVLQKNSFPNQQAPSLLNYLAQSFEKDGQTEQALAYHKQELKIYKSRKDNVKIISVLNDMMLIYQLQKKYDTAVDVAFEIYDLVRAKNNWYALSDCLNNIGYNYIKLERPKEALETFQQALLMDTQSLESKEKNAITHSNIALCYQNLGEKEKTFEHLNQALSIWQELNNAKGKIFINNLISRVYLQDKDTYNAEIYCLQAIAGAKKEKNAQLLKNSYQTYSLILQQSDEYEKALQYHEKYMGIRDSLLVEQRLEEQQRAQLSYLSERTEKELKLSLAAEDLKDFALRELKLEAEKKAKEMEVLKQANELQELEKQRVIQSLALARQTFETEKQDREIKALEQQKTMQSLRLKQKEAEEKEKNKTIKLLEKEKNIQNLTIERQKAVRNFYFAIFGFFILIFIFIFIGFVYLKKKNRVLAQQKIEIQDKNMNLNQKNEEILAQNEEIVLKNTLIDKKNENITNSIQYASRIQTAILPPLKILENFLSDSFVFFRPRDIVSGDFYWFKQIDNQLIIVAADCTGHGVPGAFMSMLGITALDEIVYKKQNHAGKILDSLRERVKKSLHQTAYDDNSKDGMDIALCIVEKDSHSLRYAGAHNPLYLIRKTGGESELIRYKADKMPISIFVHEQPFREHVVELQKGDAFYIFSDGYIDQMGGVSGRKLMSKQFQKLLLSVHERPMKEQHAFIQTKLDDWQGSYSQIDDILVMGFRV